MLLGWIGWGLDTKLYDSITSINRAVWLLRGLLRGHQMGAIFYLKENNFSQMGNKYRPLKLFAKEWQNRRMEILKIDKFTCQKCLNKKSGVLNVHHIYYIPGKKRHDYPDESLVTLCEICHTELHKLIKYFVLKDERNVALKRFFIDFYRGWLEGDTVKYMINENKIQVVIPIEIKTQPRQKSKGFNRKEKQSRPITDGKRYVAIK